MHNSCRDVELLLSELLCIDSLAAAEENERERERETRLHGSALPLRYVHIKTSAHFVNTFSRPVSRHRITIPHLLTLAQGVLNLEPRARTLTSVLFVLTSTPSVPQAVFQHRNTSEDNANLFNLED